METKIRNRSKVLHLLSLIAFLVLVWAYAQIEWGLPSTIQHTTQHSRGRILASDGSDLALTLEGKRVYPQGALAGQLLGMMGDDRGLEGLEAFYNHNLSNGEDLRITIDPRTQANAEAALAERIKWHRAKYGSLIVMETLTGRILAAATYPRFDPNNWKDYQATDRRNRPFIDTFEPGSIMKSLTVAAAMNEKLTTPDTKYHTPMKRYVGGRWGSTIGDILKHPATLDTRGILRYSSNVGISRIVQNFSSETMRDYFQQFGFGAPTPLPNVSQGKGSLQPLRNWGELVRVTNGFGQGVSATVLQLATAYNILANDGIYVPPRLVEGVSSGKRRKVLDAEVARQTRDMLETVIAEGTKSAFMEGYALAGKTGTAQVVVNGRYSPTVFNSTFAGFFPADAPRVTMVIMAHGAERQHHGSQLAAPVYRKIAAGLLSDWGAAPQIAALQRQQKAQAAAGNANNSNKPANAP